VPDLVALAGRWRPDLVVREAADYSGCLAADVLGLRMWSSKVDTAISTGV